MFRRKNKPSKNSDRFYEGLELIRQGNKLVSESIAITNRKDIKV